MEQICIKGDNFYKGGKKHLIISGAIHYFRILPECWRDRLEKLKNCGFNAVETYVCWSLHEKTEGVFDFSGRLDLGAFIDEAKNLNLDVIIRPGPYICAETDFGGLPSWLLNYDTGLRCADKIFLEKVEKYIKRLAEVLVPRLVKNGGNVQMVQIENEYGSYGNDEKYKLALKNIFEKYGIDGLFFTADGDDEDMIENGKIDGVMQALTFGSHPDERFAILNDVCGGKKHPKFCAEFWIGWYNVYGGCRMERDDESVIADLKRFLQTGASFNVYMFCGGTNYGMINGANYNDDDFRFQTTSYDYLAPISEAGDMTEKYYKIKAAIEEFTGEKIDLPVKNSEKTAYPLLKPNGFCSLLNALDKISGGKEVESEYPLSFEKLGVDFGYVLYRTKLNVRKSGELEVFGLKDRATVMLNGEIRGVLGQGLKQKTVSINADNDKGEKTLDVLVENRGRCNYGLRLKNKKGIENGIVYREKYLLDYANYPIKAVKPENLVYDLPESGNGKAGFFRFTLDIAEAPRDTFLYPKGFKNGCVYINGENAGRFCNVQPPQGTLYVAKELLKKGENEILVFETDGCENPYVEFFDKPVFGTSEKKRV
ncbi:MAG: beta-galactosidase [Candidatus Borkfalkiaceae bacterium]|nr:beta-galactosidase [Christensenellaceae bacterium]